MSKKIIKDKLYAKGLPIEIYTEDYESEFISLTDIAKYKSDEPSAAIANWLRNRNTLEFLGLWESLNNPKFNSLEFEGIRNQAGLNAFTLSPKKWINLTNSIGLVSKAGRYGGTYAHSDIAFEFASWISPEFKLYIIQDYKRLKLAENNKLSLEWNLNREISKINYRLHTDAIKEHLIVPELSPSQIGFTYASEADLLNVALFGKTARQWRSENKDKKGNIRDYASINELLVLSNMENYSAILIDQGINQSERIVTLNKFAEKQLISIEKLNTNTLKELE